MQVLDHLAGEKDTSLLGGLGNLVANRVEQHAGVVAVLLDHVGKIAAPPRIEVLNVVVERLVDVPMVRVLVHDQHAQVVAGVEQRLRARVVGRAHGVVALLAHEQDLAPLRIGKGASTQHAVVVVDAGAPKHDAVTVEEKPVIAPRKGADAKERLAVIDGIAPCRKVNTATIEVRMVRRPGAGLRHLERHRPGSVFAQLDATGCHRHLGALGEKLDRCQPMSARLERDLNAGTAAIQRERPHGNAIGPQVNRLAYPQRDGTVDAGARVPAAVGLVGVPGNNAQLAGPTGLHKPSKVHVEVRVAVRPLRNKRAVNPYLGQVADALELEEEGLTAKLLWRGPGLDVLVVASLEPAAVLGRDRLRAARLANHRVVGKRDFLERLVLLALKGNPPELPSLVKRKTLHRAPSTSHENAYEPHPTSRVLPSGSTTSQVVPRGTSTSSEKDEPSSFQLLASRP